LLEFVAHLGFCNSDLSISAGFRFRSSDFGFCFEVLAMTSTTRNILIGLALGVATGLFLGEKAQGFQLVAEAYLRLLQMTLLPYVMVSLIEGIGSLDGARARHLFVRVGTLSLVLWALALGAVMLMPLAFPEIESASFFSTTLVEARPTPGLRRAVYPV
jgi:Na+/H+-dicarboxylate symporter